VNGADLEVEAGGVSCRLDPATRQLSISTDDGISLGEMAPSAMWRVAGSAMRLDLAHRSARVERHGEGRLVVTATEPLTGVELAVDVRDQAGVLGIGGSLINRGTRAVEVEEVRLLESAARGNSRVRFPGDRAATRAFKHGWSVASPAGWIDAASGDPVLEQRVPAAWIPRWLDWMIHDANRPPRAERGVTTSEAALALANDAGGAAVLLGALGARRFFTSFRFDARASSLRVVQWGDRAELPPGGRLELEQIVMLAGLPGESVLERWADLAGAYLGARVPEARRVAWATWYAGAYKGLTERWLDERIDALVASRAPVDTVLVDDGYQTTHGDWLAPSPRFPGGLAAMARRIRERGFTPGLWIAPFAAAADSTVAREHPDWLVRDRRGRPLRTAMILSYGRPTPTYSLDTTHPEALAHVEKLAARLVALGFGVLKVDFLTGAAAPGQRFDRTATRAAAYARGMEALRRGAGNATLLSAIAPLFANAGWVDIQRLSPDTAYGRNRWISVLQRLLNDRSSPGIRNNVATTLARSFMGGRLFGADPDAIVFDGLTPELARLLATTNTLGAHLVSLGHDFARSRPDLTEVERLLTLGSGRVSSADHGQDDGLSRELLFAAGGAKPLRMRLDWPA